MLSIFVRIFIINILSYITEHEAVRREIPEP